MPSVSKAQDRLMAAACTGNSTQVPKKVGCEFMHADKGRVKDYPERKQAVKNKIKQRKGY